VKKLFLAILVISIAFVGAALATLAQPKANIPNALDRMFVDLGAANTIPDVSKQNALDRMFVDRGAANTIPDISKQTAIDRMFVDRGAANTIPDISKQNGLDRMFVDRGAANTIPDISKQNGLDRMFVDRGAARTFSSSEAFTQAIDEASVPAIPPDIERILTRGELIVAMLGVDNPPFFEQTKEGKLSGLDAELGRSIAAELGVKVKFDRSPKTFNEAVELVQKQKADLAISKLSISLGRAKQVKFSQPYVIMRQGLLVNRLQLAKRTSAGLTPEEAIKKLDGKVGVIKGTQYSIFAKKRFPKATVVEYPKWDDAIDAVGKGDILAAFRDELEIKKVVLKQPNFALQVQTVAFSDTNDLLAVIGHWQSSQLIDFVNYDLSLNKLSYTADQLIKRYEGTFRKE
jgi:polar amino acid transport system substrate-binding protein